MGKLFNGKESRVKKEKEDRLSISDKFFMTLQAELPEALNGKCQPLLYMAAIFFVVSIVFTIVSSVRSMAPFALMLSILLFLFAYLRRREMVFTGYDEFYFKTLDYTYLMKRQAKKRQPTGVILLGIDGPEGTHVKNEIYHVAVDGAHNTPDLDCLLKVYVPKDAVVSTYANRKYFSRVFAYEIEEYDI